MVEAFMFSILGITAWTDIRWFKVYNALFYPAIIIACMTTGYWIDAVIAFVLMAILLYTNTILWSGGDIKIFMLIASCVGMIFVEALVFTWCLIWGYRKISNYRLGLPVAPFALVATILAMILEATLNKIVL